MEILPNADEKIKDKCGLGVIIVFILLIFTNFAN